MCTWDESKDPRDSTLCEEESTHRVTQHMWQPRLPGRLHHGDRVCALHAMYLAQREYDVEALS